MKLTIPTEKYKEAEGNLIITFGTITTFILEYKDIHIEGVIDLNGNGYENIIHVEHCWMGDVKCVLSNEINEMIITACEREQEEMLRYEHEANEERKIMYDMIMDSNRVYTNY